MCVSLCVLKVCVWQPGPSLLGPEFSEPLQLLLLLLLLLQRGVTEAKTGPRGKKGGEGDSGSFLEVPPPLPPPPNTPGLFLRPKGSKRAGREKGGGGEAGLAGATVTCLTCQTDLNTCGIYFPPPAVFTGFFFSMCVCVCVCVGLYVFGNFSLRIQECI